MTYQSAFYTPKFAKRVATGIMCEHTHDLLVKELTGESVLCMGFGMGSCCVCSDLQFHGSKQPCGSCVEQNWIDMDTVQEHEKRPGLLRTTNTRGFNKRRNMTNTMLKKSRNNCTNYMRQQDMAVSVTWWQPFRSVEHRKWCLS